MAAFYNILKKGLFSLSPEQAHRLSVLALRCAAVWPDRRPQDPMLHCNIAGMNLPAPLGLAAGYDKNAEAICGVARLGFGFVEVGTVTPLAQPGNPKPRLFRLLEDEAVINRLGFNNDGLEVVARRLARRRGKGVVGANIGANKNSTDRIGDYVVGLKRLTGLADYFTVNISSPNTPGLRGLQDAAQLDELLRRVTEARAQTSHPATPIFVKLAPDLSETEIDGICKVIQTAGIEGLVISNTTLARPMGLKSAAFHEQGGLSGRPLMAPSTKLLGEFYRRLGARIPLIGVGGISSAEDAYAKIKAGASALQLYTALVYQGPDLVGRIHEGLAMLLRRDGFASIAEAVGAAHR